MKTVLLFIILLTSCAPVQPPGCNMNWSCNNNTRCIQQQGSNGNSGFFQTESDCLIWETAFINSYAGATVTSCSCH
jgi:hypothetical protein